MKRSVRWLSPKQTILIALFCVALCVILFVGYMYAERRIRDLERFHRAQFLNQAVNIAGVISRDSARALSFSPDAAQTAPFIRIQRQLEAYASFASIHRIYLLGRHENTLVYGPSYALDVPPPPVGQAYPHATEHRMGLLETGHAFIAGPEAGVISAMAPFHDDLTHEVLGAVVIERTFESWKQELYHSWWAPIIAAALVCLLLSVSWGLILLRNRLVASKRIRPMLHLETMLTAVFCVAVGLIIAAFTLELENVNRYEKFNDVARAGVAIANHTFQNTQRRLSALAASVEPVSGQNRFQEQSSTLMAPSSVTACYFIPMVYDGERSAFESYIQEAGAANYAIHQRNAEGALAPAPSADVYFPVQYRVSGATALFAPGFNMASLPDHLSAMRAALETNQTTSALIHSHGVAGALNGTRIIAYAPVRTAQEHASALVAVELCLQALLQQMTLGDREAPALFTTQLFEVQPDSAPLQLSAYPTHPTPPVAVASFFAEIFGGELFEMHPLSAFGHSLILLLRPQQAFFISYRPQTTLNTIIMALWLTVAFTLAIGLLRYQQGTLESRVWQRTMELAEREETFRRLFADSMEPMLLLRKGVFVDCNAAALGLLHYDDKHMLLRRRPEEISPKYQPDGRRSAEVMREMIACCVERGHHMFEFNYLRYDDAIVPVETMFTLISIRGVNHIHLTWRDITERRRAEEALRESEEKYRGLIASLPIGLYRISPDQQGRFLMANNALAAIRGFSGPDAMLDYDFKRLYVYPEDYTLLVNELMVEGYVSGKEALLKRMDGKTLWASITVRSVRTPAGHLEYFDGSLMDITERKQAAEQQMEMERRLLHTQKLESLGVLAGGIAHDFNNLLMAILGHLELALEDMERESPEATLIEKSITAARRAAMLTSQMLAYSGKGRFVVQALDANSLLQENIRIFRASVLRNITIDLQLQPDLPLIQADEGQIQQVVMNLITNASEAIGDTSGTVTISTGVMYCDEAYLQQSHLYDKPEPGDFVWVQVSDSGCGMDAETIKKIFDPFFTTKFTGRGLGMSAVLGIMKGHQGALMINSNVGEGTAIRVLFPVAVGSATLEPPLLTRQNEKMANAAPLIPPSDIKTDSPGTAVLIVDDEETLRELGENILERCGYRTYTAADGVEALRIFKKHKNDIAAVLLDLTMPNMDGVAAFSALKNVKPDIKIILCSGFSEHEALERFDGRNLDGFVHKPYRIAALRAEIERVLG